MLEWKYFKVIGSCFFLLFSDVKAKPSDSRVRFRAPEVCFLFGVSYPCKKAWSESDQFIGHRISAWSLILVWVLTVRHPNLYPSPKLFFFLCDGHCRDLNIQYGASSSDLKFWKLYPTHFSESVTITVSMIVFRLSLLWSKILLCKFSLCRKAVQSKDLRDLNTFIKYFVWHRETHPALGSNVFSRGASLTKEVMYENKLLLLFPCEETPINATLSFQVA